MVGLADYPKPFLKEVIYNNFVQRVALLTSNYVGRFFGANEREETIESNLHRWHGRPAAPARGRNRSAAYRGGQHRFLIG